MAEVQVIRRVASNGVDEDYWQIGPNVWKARTGCAIQQWGTPKDAECVCSTYRWRHGVFKEEVTKQANRGRTLTLIQA